MSRTLSPSSKQPYGVARVSSVWKLARSSFYAARQRQQRPHDAPKRGPKVRSDDELVAEIRVLLAAPIFAGEGYRKIWARLRHKGVRTSKDRVLRLLREHQLLSASRQPEPRPTNPHEGTIGAAVPDRMWGTDATATFTEAEGNVTVFAAIDHCTAECVGIHAVKKATRFEALEPICQALKEHFGAFSAAAAKGLILRHDHGSVYMSDDFQTKSNSWESSHPRRSYVSRKEMDVSSASFVPSKNRSCGSADSTTSRNCGPPSLNSEIAITITGSWSA